MKLINIRLLGLLLWVSAGNSFGDPYVEIRHVEWNAIDQRARFFVNVFEMENGGIKYPISTLSKNDVQYATTPDFMSNFNPQSLNQFGYMLGGLKRATVLIYAPGAQVHQKQNQEIVQSLAEIIPEIKTHYFSIINPTLKGNQELIEVTPEKYENSSEIQRIVLTNKLQIGKASLTETICSGALRFERWSLDHFSNADQKVFILAGSLSAHKGVDAEFRNCLKKLQEERVRVFYIDILPQSTPAEITQHQNFLKSSALGGFSQKISASYQITEAMNNILSFLDKEYIFDGPVLEEEKFATGKELHVRVNWHSRWFAGAPFKLLTSIYPDGLTKSRSSPPTKPVETSSFGFWMDLVEYIFIVLLFVAGILVYLKKWYATKYKCATCDHIVKKDFQDCPFRSRETSGRVFIINGRSSGMVVPLFKGENIIGTQRGSHIRLLDAGVKNIHGSIEIRGNKALYVRRQKNVVDTVNGWEVLEPRLLNSHAIIKIGTVTLRFEPKFSSVQKAHVR